jgi:phenylacetate-CoA ligase
MLDEVLRTNPFYGRKLEGRFATPLKAWGELSGLPFTTKQELVDDQLRNPPFGSDLTYPSERYVRVHQTSGTTGRPMYWLDTEASWEWWGECWKAVLEAAGVGRGDRVFFAFSFGPFIGFWSGWEGARKVGALAVSGGGQTTQQRLRSLMEYEASVLVCTPTYALHMAAEAHRAGIDLARQSAVRVTVHAGEPGASIASTKQRIEEAWGARCFDHTGATEVGAFGFACDGLPGVVHVNEDEFIAEVVDVESGQPLPDGGVRDDVTGREEQADAESGQAPPDGRRGELVLTNLGRVGSPVIRYRTGDLVEPHRGPCACGRDSLVLNGGVLGRVDDMVVVRGVNVFPSAVEGIVRRFPEVEEFRVDVFETGGLAELKVTVEPAAAENSAGLKEGVTESIRDNLHIRPVVEVVAPGTLPRFELKARRFFRS